MCWSSEAQWCLLDGENGENVDSRLATRLLAGRDGEYPATLAPCCQRAAGDEKLEAQHTADSGLNLLRQAT